MKTSKVVLVLVIALLVYVFFAFDLAQYLNLEYLKSKQANIDAYYQANPWKTSLIYVAIYIAVTGLSLPGAAIMTLAGGAIFGLTIGTLVVSFASTIGATLAFLVSRFLLYHAVQNKFGKNLQAVNEGIKKDGAFYLFTLRLVPIFPFFMINLVMGLTPIRTIRFFLVSQIGMLAGTLVYVNAGTQIAKLESLSGILSPGLLASFVLLGMFPLIAKKLVDFIKARKVLRNYKRPRSFDRNLVVIGAGSAGLVSAYIAASVKAKVTLIEKAKMGGDCLNTGCVPSKALIRSAKLLSHIRRAQEFGLKSASADFDFADIMERVQRIIKTIEPHDSIERYTKLGVECIQGEAKITSPYTVEVNGQVLTTRNIAIATGARPFVPLIPGIEDSDYLTSDTIWDLRVLPKRLVVLGGGPIGCELTQCFQRLGSQVIQIEMLPRIMAVEDPEISEMVSKRFRAEGIDVRVKHRAKEIQTKDGHKLIICEHEGQDVLIEFDQLLVAVGRSANTKGFGLEELGIPTTKRGTIEVNEYLQTVYPNIYACGDVVGPYQFTHVASHQAWYTSVNALFGGLRKFKVDYKVIPWSTFTDPEVAWAGLTEDQCKAQGVKYSKGVFPWAASGRAIANGRDEGFTKLIFDEETHRIIGGGIVGTHAGDLISEICLAIEMGADAVDIGKTIHPHPTLGESVGMAAEIYEGVCTDVPPARKR